MRRSLWFATFGLLVACGQHGDAHTHPDGSPPEVDAPPVPDAPPPVARIQVSTTIEPRWVAFRDGPTAPWQTVLPESLGHYAFDAHGPYDVTVLCEQTHRAWDLVTMLQVGRTLDDPHDIEAPCEPPSRPVVNVTGTVKQAGQVSLGPYSTDGSLASPWVFDIIAPNGAFDLLARSATHFLIVRDVPVAGHTTVPGEIDVDGNGVPLIPAPVVVTNAQPSDDNGLLITVETPSTLRMHLSSTGLAGGVKVPESALRPTDEQLTTVIRRGFRDSAHVQRLTSGSTTFTLPARIDAATFAIDAGELVASWTSLPAHDVVQLVAYDSSRTLELDRRHTREVTAGYLAAVGASAIRIETDLPDFEPRWRVDFTAYYTRLLNTLAFGSDREIAWSGISSVPNPSLNAAPPSARAREHQALDELAAIRRRWMPAAR